MNPLAAIALALATAACSPEIVTPKPTAITRSPGRPAGPRGFAFVPGVRDYEDRGPALRPLAFTNSAKSADPELGKITVVYLGEEKIARLTVTLTHRGKPLADMWEESLKTLFVYFDRDKDGSLNAYELEQCYSASGMRQLFFGQYYTPAAGPAPEMRDLDKDRDHQVSPAEFTAYFAELAEDLFRTRMNPPSVGDATTAELIARLDLNKDGKLSQAELKRAEELVIKLDTDEDETITFSEVYAALPPSRTTTAMNADMDAMMMGMNARKGTTEAGVSVGDLFLNPGRQVRGEVVLAIIKKFDKNKNESIEADEHPFDQRTFARLDADKSGTLTTTELHVWTREPSECNLTIDTGTTSTNGKITTTTSLPEGVILRQIKPDSVVLRFGKDSIQLWLYSPKSELTDREYQMMLNEVFASDKEAISEEDMGGVQFQFVRSIFDAADTNADGLLTRAELQSYFNIQRQTMNLSFALQGQVMQPTFYHMLDDNRDNKLTVRELRTAWDRLIVLEPPGATQVTKNILRPIVSLQASPGVVFSGAALPFGDTGNPRRVETTTEASGPLWFRKMDRNTDGDLSRAEFLGSPEQFNMMDTNKDDLISKSEAEAYDKKTRATRPAKKKK